MIGALVNNPESSTAGWPIHTEKLCRVDVANAAMGEVLDRWYSDLGAGVAHQRGVDLRGNGDVHGRHQRPSGIEAVPRRYVLVAVGKSPTRLGSSPLCPATPCINLLWMVRL